MDVPEVVITMGGEQWVLSEDNCWVCLFTEAPQYDHLYVHEPKVCAVFECRALLDQLMHLGFPMQVRRLPRPWDESAFTAYMEKQLDHLDEELDALEGGGE